ncbi:MAG: transglycosylase SLT domain-containing protein, partial [Myxococcaceae bacterium]
VPSPARSPASRGADAGVADARFQAADLSPYFGAGALAKARSQLDAGLFVEARASLEGQGDSPPVRYLRATAAEGAADHATAAQEWTALARDYPVLADRCALYAGRSGEALSDWEAAAARYASVGADSLLFADARLGLSRALRQQQDLEGARKALGPIAEKPAPMWGRDVGAEALLAISDLAREGKDRKGEKQALTRLWSSHPLSPQGEEAGRRLGGAAKLPRDAAVARAEVLIEAHRNRPGIAVLEPLLPGFKLPDPLACRAHFAYGKGLRKERQHTRAVAALTPVVEGCKDPDLRARALYTLGQSKAIVEVGGAPATYETLARDYPAHSFADDALFFAADCYVKGGDPESAVKRIEELAARYPTGDFLAEGLFKAFWIRRSQKKAGAVSYLDRLEKQFATADETYEVERARYWRARTLEAGGDQKGAGEIYEALALEHPATYYGLISRWRLDGLDPARAAKVAAGLLFPAKGTGPFPLRAGPLGESAHFAAGVELLRLGFTGAASEELLAANRPGLPAESLRLLVHVLAAAGDARGAHAVSRVSLRKDLTGRITAESRPVWEVAYPVPFRELIEKHSKAANGLDPDLLQALMREESALDPKALSWAGALGLTQLMPSTAYSMAAQLKMKMPSTQAILDPDLNIQLGATYLAGLSKRYRGVRQFALAGYNAGQSAVDRWRKERPAEELDVWVENIPLAETRGYVKRVLRSYNTYQLLYPAPPQPPTPELGAK